METKTDMETKVCTNCKVEKSFDLYVKNPKGRFGLRGACRECNKISLDMRTAKGYIKIKDRPRSLTSKVCTKCNIEKQLFEFSKSKNGPFGHGPSCKDCRKVKYQLNRERNLYMSCKWSKENPLKIRKLHIEARIRNNGKVSEKVKAYIKGKYNRDKCDSVKMFRENAYRSIRLLIKRCNEGKKARDSKYLIVIGCSVQEYIDYLTRQFTDDMSWSNYGPKTWHIDHIIPLSKANTKEELIALFHYTNTQPLDARENHFKADKVIYKSEYFKKALQIENTI